MSKHTYVIKQSNRKQNNKATKVGKQLTKSEILSEESRWKEKEIHYMYLCKMTLSYMRS